MASVCQGAQNDLAASQIVQPQVLDKEETQDSLSWVSSLFCLWLTPSSAYSGSCRASGFGCAGPSINARSAGSLSSRHPGGNVQNRRIIISFRAMRDLLAMEPSPSGISISRTLHRFPWASATSRHAPWRAMVTVRHTDWQTSETSGLVESTFHRYLNGA